MVLYLGADHGGFTLKMAIKECLVNWDVEFVDCGAMELDEQDDYPQFAFAVAQHVARDLQNHRGILICKSSGGMVIAANKVTGIRAVSVQDEQSVVHARKHNDANIIGIGAELVNEKMAEKIVRLFLETPFSNEERHLRRIKQIEEYELKLSS